MTKYRIPEPFKPGFELISKLSKKHVNVIKKALTDTPIGSGPEDTAKSIEDKINFKSSEVRNIINTIFSLISLNIREEVEKEEFINDIVTSYDDINPSLGEDKREKLIEYLQTFLEADGQVKHTIKAATLLSENKKIFIESRVLSDIRIIFEEKIENPKQCAVIIHQLKIIYHENGEPKEIFIALDKEDLNQLKETANRAIQKDKLIRNNTYKEISFIELYNK